MQNANDKCRSPITNKCLDNGWVLLLLLILSTTKMRPHKQRMMMLNKNWKYDNRSAVTINVSTNLTWWTSMIIMTAVTPFLIGIEVCSGHVDRNVGVRWWWQQYVKTELSPAQASPAQAAAASQNKIWSWSRFSSTLLQCSSLTLTAAPGWSFCWVVKFWWGMAETRHEPWTVTTNTLQVERTGFYSLQAGQAARHRWWRNNYSMCP